MKKVFFMAALVLASTSGSNVCAMNEAVQEASLSELMPVKKTTKKTSKKTSKKKTTTSSSSTGSSIISGILNNVIGSAPSRRQISAPIPGSTASRVAPSPQRTCWQGWRRDCCQQDRGGSEQVLQ